MTEYEVYKVTLELKSTLSTKLMVDTFWGHICWGILAHEGETVLKNFLNEMCSSTPPIVLSTPFPADYFPLPTIPLLRSRKLEISWLPSDKFSTLINNISPENMDSLNRDYQEPPLLSKSVIARVTVNRLYKTKAPTALEEQEPLSQLFFDTRFYPTNISNFDVFIKSTLSSDDVRKLINYAIEFGYGKDTTAGAGWFILKSFTKIADLPKSNQPNAIMTLSECVPSPNDPTDGFWRTFVKFGKLGGSYATLGQDDEKNHPFKKPLIMLRPGAVFKTDNPNQTFIGQMIPNIHPIRSEVIHYGYGFTIPVTLSSEYIDLLESTNA